MLDGENARLEALDHFDVLDTPPEESFDRITRLARRLFDVPMATIAFLDAHREWFKSVQGLGMSEVDRAPTFCNIAIQQPRPLVVEDTWLSDQFRDNMFVTGEPKLRFYAGCPLTTPEGHNVGILCVMDTKPRLFGADDVDALCDLARIAMTQLELRNVAVTDGLTGLLSRRAFTAEAERMVDLATRHRLPVSCIAFDLDRFKSVNDRFGHGGGDAVLRATAQTCTATLRRSDLIGRMGGEEFTILLPHTRRDGAMEVAEKLRAAIAAQTIVAPNGETIPVSASFGVVGFDRASPNMQTMFEHADQALYDAKNSGRNMCRTWSPPVDTITANMRRRVLKAGRISFNFGRSAIDCTVRSLSHDGAGIDVTSTAGVPDMFKLRIDADDLSVPCRVLSKKDRHLEVMFA